MEMRPNGVGGCGGRAAKSETRSGFSQLSHNPANTEAAYRPQGCTRDLAVFFVDSNLHFGTCRARSAWHPGSMDNRPKTTENCWSPPANGHRSSGNRGPSKTLFRLASATLAEGQCGQLGLDRPFCWCLGNNFGMPHGANAETNGCCAKPSRPVAWQGTNNGQPGSKWRKLHSMCAVGQLTHSLASAQRAALSQRGTSNFGPVGVYRGLEVSAGTGTTRWCCAAQER